MPYQIQIEGLDKLRRNLQGAGLIVNRHLKDAMNRSVIQIRDDVVKNTPVDTGRLWQSIMPEVKGLGGTMMGMVSSKDKGGNEKSNVKSVGAKVGSMVEYAPMVEFGTKPHEITPKRGRALRFKINNAWVFAKKVNHPGTKGFFMFKKGMEQNVGFVKEKFAKAIEKIAEDLAR